MWREGSQWVPRDSIQDLEKLTVVISSKTDGTERWGGLASATPGGRALREMETHATRMALIFHQGYPISGRSLPASDT